MWNPSLKHPSSGTTGWNIFQNEKYVSNSSTWEGSVRTSGQLRGRERMGGSAYQNLSNER